MISPANVFSPYIQGPGLNLTVSSGQVLVSGVPTVVLTTIVGLTANATNYVYLNIGTGLVQSSTSSFGAGSYPIATVVTSLTGIKSLVDSRPDFFTGAINAGGAVLLAPSGAQTITGFPLALSGLDLAETTVSSNYVAQATDNVIRVNAAGGSVQVTIPNTTGGFYRVKKIDSSSNPVSIVPSGGTIDGVASKALVAQNQSLDIQGNGVGCDTFGGGIASASTTVSYSATPTFASGAGAVQHFRITLTGNVSSSTLSGGFSGQILIFEIIQDATGSRTFVWPTNVKNPGDIDQAANAINVQAFVFDATNGNAYPFGPLTIN